ncbi:hypothetical protein BI291_12900 [Thalassotalea sp. PP2-459]|nr:hypothetical protein BI291_12900 [Thalassotalea sp. PP2-459]
MGLLMLKNRPVQEQVLIVLSLAIAAILAPFGAYRLIHADWIIGIFDISVTLLLILLSINVYEKRHIDVAKKALSIFVFSAVLITVYLKGKPQAVWLYPAIPLIFYLTTPLIAARVTILSIAVMAFLMHEIMPLFELMTMIFTYLGTGICSFAFGYQWHKHQQELIALTVTDPLTNIKNRRAFNDDLATLTTTIKHSEEHVLLIFDIDNFKHINDIYGHDIGDNVLISITEIAQSILPENTELYRIGGEEFIIIFHGITQNSAEKFAHLLRHKIASAEMLENQQVTISIGVAGYQESGYCPSKWFKRADKALYRAKENGRNCVSFASSPKPKLL